MLPKFLLLAIGASSVFGASPVSRFAPFEGGRVHYESYGVGKEAVVFIHGWTCDLTFWRAQEPVYRAHRSLLIDLPGHGESDKPMAAYPTEFFARGIEAVISDAGVEQAILVGHSLGGPIAYAFIRMFPEQARALVLVDSTVGAEPNTASYRAAQQQRYEKRAQSLTGPAGEKYFLAQVEGMFSPKASPALRSEIRTKMLATPEWVRVAAVTSPSQLDPPPPGQIFPIPALAIQAAQKGTEQRAAAMRTIFPSMRLEKWEHSGHFLMMEDPARFNRSLEKFLAGLQ